MLCIYLLHQLVRQINQSCDDLKDVLSIAMPVSLMFIQEKGETIQVEPLGAGQDVGRSCVIVKIKDKNIMFDVGLHMLHNDIQRFPDFAYLIKERTINECIDLVLVTHFHLDHCGALPYLTQFFGYSGPIYCTAPTKAMLPYMLQDLRKVSQDIGSTINYSQQQIKNCFSKVKSLALFQTLEVAGIKITSYYAGHVLGASMFHVEYQGLSAVYTGDYNSTADRHLGAAEIPKLRPNIVLTETTYATTIRDTKRERERKMLKLVSETLEKGGKVLIPVFALGRAQQLCVLLETYWTRTQNPTPIYFSAGMIEKANFYYKLFVGWENQKIKESFLQGNAFEFKHIKPFDKNLIRSTSPMVVLATPGMLHGGMSMNLFKQWCGNQNNTLIIPGFCVPGSLGNKLLSGVKNLTIDKKNYQVKMRIQSISFSAHADAKGIMNLLKHLQPQAVVFVHGEKNKMKILSQIVEPYLNLKVYMPANHERKFIPATVRTQMVSTQAQQGLGHILSINNKLRFILEQDFLREVNQITDLIFTQKDMMVCDNCILTTLPVKSDPKSFLQDLKMPSEQVQQVLLGVVVDTVDNQILVTGQYNQIVRLVKLLQQ